MAPRIPHVVLSKLKEIDPEATFEGTLPRIQSSSGAVYFVKVGSPSEAAQYEGEAQSLQAINKAAPDIAPRVLKTGVSDTEEPYFISQYKDTERLSSKAAEVLAKRMATELHSPGHANPTGFGFPIPTYCGVTKLENGLFERWDECYASMIGDLLEQLQRKGRYQNLCLKGEKVKTQYVFFNSTW